MTVEDIRKMDKDFLTPLEVSAVLGSNPQDVRDVAKLCPERIGYPFTFTGNRMKIPRIGFLNWFDGKGCDRATGV